MKRAGPISIEKLMSNKTLAFSIAAVLLIFAGAVFFWNRRAAQNQKDSFGYFAYQTPVAESPLPESNLVKTAQCKREFDEKKLKTGKVKTENRQVEILVKDFGAIVVSLNSKAAPKTSENFLKLVNAKFYDCLTFHRIVKDFVIQGGDPIGNGSGGPGYTVPAEIKLLHKKGSLAMARLSDEVNPKKESSGSQFYIALNDLPQLDGQYTVFGEVIKGMDVVEKIGQVDTSAAPPVVMESVKIIK